MPLAEKFNVKYAIFHIKLSAKSTLNTLGFVCRASGRGVGDGKSQLAEDMKLLGGVSWWYDWGLVPAAGTTSPGQEFVAMAWGAQHKGEPLKQCLLRRICQQIWP